MKVLLAEQVSLVEDWIACKERKQLEQPDDATELWIADMKIRLDRLKSKVTADPGNGIL
jgi:hypothetical protein